MDMIRGQYELNTLTLWNPIRQNKKFDVFQACSSLNTLPSPLASSLCCWPPCRLWSCSGWWWGMPYVSWKTVSVLKWAPCFYYTWCELTTTKNILKSSLGFLKKWIVPWNASDGVTVSLQDLCFIWSHFFCMYIFFNFNIDVSINLWNPTIAVWH